MALSEIRDVSLSPMIIKSDILMLIEIIFD